MTRAREVQTRGTNQRGRTTTEATDQGSDQGLHVGFIDAGLQQIESKLLGSVNHSLKSIQLNFDYLNLHLE